MMLAKVISGATVGLNAVPITVEVDISAKGLPSFQIVGLPDKAIEESKERVRSALKNSGADFPDHRITINLAPADLPKEGPAYDLPIALGMLIASGQLPDTLNIQDALVFGELSLDGSVQHASGILPMALLAREKGFKRLFIPSLSAKEASVINTITIYPTVSLLSLFYHLSNQQVIAPEPFTPFSELSSDIVHEFDMEDIRGQEHAKRALEIAAAGGHNVFLKGPPGAGKTLLARTFPSILPDLTEDEALEVTKIYSITGNLKPGDSLIKTRPFRSPHHTTSRMGLIGGGTKPMPGEISLAHRGVLFLDEAPELPRNVLEALRQPLEDGIVTVSRAAGSVTYPAKFTLIAAANPCPCGYLGHEKKQCRCMPGQILRYQKRISGPILDRIDLHITCPALSPDKMSQIKKGETSESIRIRVQKARDRQLTRFANTKLKSNAEMGSKDIKQFCELSSECIAILRQAIANFHLSARAYNKVIKLSRTIADLEGSEQLLPMHIAESLQYRPKMEEEYH